jgi:hypothetical protein
VRRLLVGLTPWSLLLCAVTVGYFAFSVIVHMIGGLIQQAPHPSTHHSQIAEHSSLYKSREHVFGRCTIQAKGRIQAKGIIQAKGRIQGNGKFRGKGKIQAKGRIQGNKGRIQDNSEGLPQCSA